MKLFDLHCDTAYLIYRNNVELKENDRHVSIEKAKAFDAYVQNFAFFASPKQDNDTAYGNYLLAYDKLLSEVEKNSEDVTVAKTSDELRRGLSENRMVILPAVEDARILGNDISRLEVLRQKGTWYLTLLWGGDTVIGGSHNTSNGLTDFGKNVVRACFEQQIIPDISHASEASADDTVAIAYECGKPIIASHSNSYSVYSHSRNLRDRHLSAIKELGGIVGISLCDSHLADKNEADTDITDVIRHIEYYMANGAADILCIGADWDGTSLPRGFSDIRDASKIYSELVRLNYTDGQLDKIFFKNAFDFYSKLR